ncbi:MAG: amidohydrolase, partial [Anaerolineae bacterium]|nr:amidohydrolase [Anaerolineae bacterium]
GVHNGMPNRPLAELVVANMRALGAPTYTDEELAFARELARSISPEEKRTSLSKSLLPDAMELMDVDLNTRIYDPYGEERKGGGGSSDVADVAWNTPTQEFSTAYFIVGSPGHSWQNAAIGGTSIAHKSTLFASQVMATSVLDLLTRPDLLEQVKADWRQRMQGLAYKCPLPRDLEPPLDQLEHKE